MRLFIGRSAAIHNYPALQAAFNPCLKGRWTPPQNLHLTLIFIGEAHAPQRVIERLGDITFPAGPLTLAGAGSFGRPVNVFFARCALTPELKTLEKTVRDRLGIVSDKPFSPHVTLMRPKVFKEPDRFNEALGEWRDKPLGECAGPWKLYKSTLRPEGPVYEVLHVF